MDSFNPSLGVPGAKIIEPIHDRQPSNHQRQQKKKPQEKDENKDTNAGSGDKITLSGSEIKPDKQTSKPTDSKASKRGKGDFIDIQA